MGCEVSFLFIICKLSWPLINHWSTTDQWPLMSHLDAWRHIQMKRINFLGCKGYSFLSSLSNNVHRYNCCPGLIYISMPLQWPVQLATSSPFNCSHPIPSIIFCHSNSLHILLHYIHKSMDFNPSWKSAASISKCYPFPQIAALGLLSVPFSITSWTRKHDLTFKLSLRRVFADSCLDSLLLSTGAKQLVDRLRD